MDWFINDILIGMETASVAHPDHYISDSLEQSPGVLVSKSRFGVLPSTDTSISSNCHVSRNFGVDRTAGSHLLDTLVVVVAILQTGFSSITITWLVTRGGLCHYLCGAVG